MNLIESLNLVTTSLSKECIKHALIGGLALAAHGVVRATVDIDLLIDGDDKDAVKTVLFNLGFSIFHETDEILQLSGPAQLDIILANRPLSKNLLNQAKSYNDFPLPVVSAEGLIGLKIQAYKNDPKRELQDKADIQALLTQNQNLDFSKIKEYADLFNEWGFILKTQELIK
ncbi:MAG: hypothetical protein ACRBBP_08395 [Bdellovibrionales bacterium]